VRPAGEDFRQGCCLRASRRQVPLENGHEHDIALGGIVPDVLGDDCSALRAGNRRDLRVFGRLEADLSNVYGVVAVGMVVRRRSWVDRAAAGRPARSSDAAG